MAAPSPQPVPSASWEKDLQRPSAAIPLWAVKETKGPRAITEAPPARAMLHSPLRRDCAAQCRATREEEQAVSTVTAGPSPPRV